MRSPRSLFLLALLAGCSAKNKTTSSTEAGAASASVVVSAPDAAAPSVAKAPGSDAGAKAAPSTDDRRAFAKALDEGRKKTRAKDYTGALADFDRALALSPDDGRVLSEIGYAAMLAGDHTRAESANRQALRVVHDPLLRAQILYNAGRSAEAKGEKEAARNLYGESLGLRENAEVRRRFTANGGTDAAPAMGCAQGAKTVEALCTCLVATREVFTGMGNAKPVCGATAASLSLGTPRLSVIRLGAPEDGPGERLYVLVARDGATLRPVADLGSDYEPGAFGVHNEAKVVGGVVKPAGTRSVVVVTSEQDDLDHNLAGLEACTHVEKRETVCALGEGDKPTRCVTVPISTESGCGPGVQPEDLDAESRALLAERKKDWGKTSSKHTWSVAPDGSLVVKSDKGKTTTHALF